MNSNRASSDIRDAQAASANPFPSFLVAKPEEGPMPTTELGLQRRHFEGAISSLAMVMSQLGPKLAPVMRSAEAVGPTQAVPGEAGTPLGQWLADQTAVVNRLSIEAAVLMHRIDL